MSIPSEGSKKRLSDSINFIGLDEDARETLRPLKPFLDVEVPNVLGRFYERVSQTPEMARHFSSEAHMQGAKAKQGSHWARIAEGNFDADYSAAVTAIGRVHSRIGLEPRWYIGGYAFVLDRLMRGIVDHVLNTRDMMVSPGKVRGKLTKAVTATMKAAFLDMELAISVYLEAEEERRRAAEQVTERENIERKTAIDELSRALSDLSNSDLTSHVSDGAAASL